MTAITASAVKELRDKTGVSMMACKKALEETAGDVQAAVELLRKRGEAVAQKRSSHAATEGRIVAGRQGDFVALVEVSAETDFTARNEDFGNFATSVLNTVLTAHPSDLDTLLSTTSKYLHSATVQQATTDIVGKIGENISVRRFVLKQVEEGTTVESYIHGPGKIGVIVTLAHAGVASNDKIVALAKDLLLQIAAAAPVAVESAGISEDVLAKEREIYKEQAANEGLPEAKISMVIEGRVKKFLKEAALVEQLFVKDNKQTVGKVVEQVGKEVGATIKVVSFSRWQLGEAL
ncbi:MAG: translation elongation factor Ts [Fibrobacterota bacterium]|jgi:elongation factor Ts